MLYEEHRPARPFPRGSPAGPRDERRHVLPQAQAGGDPHLEPPEGGEGTEDLLGASVRVTRRAELEGGRAAR